MLGEQKPVPAVLASLSELGISQTAPASLRETVSKDKKWLLPDCGSLQRHYFRNNAARDGAMLTGLKCLTYTHMPPNAAVAPLQVPLVTKLEVIQVPAALALPIKMKKKIDPPLIVRMSCVSLVPLCLPITVSLFAVDEEAVASMETWAPGPKPSGLQVNHMSIARTMEPCSTVDETVAATLRAQSGGCGMGLDGGGILYEGAWEFSFASLCFDRPSQMRPRWLVIQALIPNTDAALYTQLINPTIVMCRPVEQLEKANRLLWPGPPSPPRPPALTTGSCPDAVSISEGGEAYAHNAPALPPQQQRRSPPMVQSLTLPPHSETVKSLMAYFQKSLGLKRGFSLQCAQALARYAGIDPSSSAGRELEYVSREILTNPYIQRTKQLLALLRSYFEVTEPMVICDFSVGREQAEEALFGRPPGTFLLRFGSQAGSLVQSVVMNSLGEINHILVTLEELQMPEASLESIINTMHHGTTLLDITTGRLHPKNYLFRREYVSAMELQDIMTVVEFDRKSPPKKSRIISGSISADNIVGMKRKSTASPDLSMPNPQQVQHAHNMQFLQRHLKMQMSFDRGMHPISQQQSMPGHTQPHTMPRYDTSNRNQVMMNYGMTYGAAGATANGIPCPPAIQGPECLIGLPCSLTGSLPSQMQLQQPRAYPLPQAFIPHRDIMEGDLDLDLDLDLIGNNDLQFVNMNDAMVEKILQVFETQDQGETGNGESQVLSH